jgi:hypothetical protein
MFSQRVIVACLAALLAVFTSSCATSKKTAQAAPPDNRSWWKGDSVQGKPRIVINLSEQRLKYFKGGELVGVSPISSGREGNGTLNGKFSVIEKDIDHRSSLFGAYVDEAGKTVVADVDTRKDARPSGTKFIGANMRYFMRIVGGIGMHEGYLPGYPASHGCIRLPTKMAAIFFRETPHGTPVEVIGHGSQADNEGAIPLSHDDPEAVPTAPADVAENTKVREESDARKVPKKEIRRAIVVFERDTDGVLKARLPRRSWFSRPKAGETYFLQ